MITELEEVLDVLNSPASAGEYPAARYCNEKAVAFCPGLFALRLSQDLLLLAGFDAEDRIGRAVAHQRSGQWHNANPPPGGLRAHKYQGNQYNAHNCADNPVC